MVFFLRSKIYPNRAEYKLQIDNIKSSSQMKASQKDYYQKETFELRTSTKFWQGDVGR